MNYFVNNNEPDNLKTVIYGSDGAMLRAIAVDADGRFLFSPESAVGVTATNLDIRDLNSSTDSVLVTANGLDIRALNGSEDSVQVSGKGFVENNVSTTVSGTTPLLTTDISAYSENSFFLRNTTTGASLTLAVQVAPINDNAYFTTITDSSGSISGVGNYIGSVTATMRYARLSVTVSSGSASVIAYYNGRA